MRTFLGERLREPSTWAAACGIILTVSEINTGTLTGIAAVAALACGVVAAFLRDESIETPEERCKRLNGEKSAETSAKGDSDG